MEIEHLDGKKHIVATAPGEIISNLEFKSIKNLGVPFYKDPMSHGNLIIEFKVDFPKKNFFTKEAADKLIKILETKPQIELSKDKAKNKILEDYNAADLNPSPRGGDEREDYQSQFGGGGSGRQEVKCQQQ